METDLGRPGFVPQLDFAFDMVLEFHSRLRFGPKADGGSVGFVGLAGGRIVGPLLKGCVVANSGGDWANMRADGVVEFRAHYLLEADDGTMIHIHNSGYGRASPEPLEIGGEFDEQELQQHYFRVTPRFETPVGKHDWLTSHILVGFGERRRAPDHTICHYYVVR